MCLGILNGTLFAQITEEPVDLFSLYSDQINYWQQIYYSEGTAISPPFAQTTPDETTLGALPPLSEAVTYDPFRESPIKSLIYIRDLYSDEVFSRKSNYPEWDYLFDQYLITYCNPFLYIEDDTGTIISIPFDLSTEIEKNDTKEDATIIWIERKYHLTFTDSHDVDWIKFPLLGKGVWELELTPFFQSDPNSSPFKVSTFGNLPTQPQFENFSSQRDDGYNGYLSYSSHIINYNAWGGWVYIKIAPYTEHIFIANGSFPVTYYLQIKYKNYYDDVSILGQAPSLDFTWYQITPIKRESTRSICMTTFLGKVVDADGIGIPGMELTLTRGENFELTVFSGGDGYFLFSPISSNASGLEYELSVGDTTATCQVIGECGTIYLDPATYSCLTIEGTSFLDPDGDADGDGITNSRERIIGTNPLRCEITLDKGLNFFRFPLWIYNPEKSIDLGSIIPTPSIITGIIIDPYDMPDSAWQLFYDASGTIPISNKSGGMLYLEHATILSVPSEYGRNYLDLFDPSSNAYNPYYCSMIDLYEGRNLLGLFGFQDKDGIVQPLGDGKFSSFAFLDSLKSATKENDPGMIMTVDTNDGKWQSTYSFFGRTSGKEHNLKIDTSYVIIMNKDKGIKNWIPGSY
ncbi:MAG: carboxypeptidase-like regulatory domain-containing protein [bacterium]